jgi:putative DNA methylase
MAIFSKYAAVLEADGTPMSVETALRLINKFLADDDFDADTQFCLHWFEQHGWAEGPFGEADQLARAKGTAVNGLVQAGVVEAGRGKVRLFRPAEFQADWTPEADDRLPVWEVLHQLIRLFQAGGDSAAGATISAVAAKADGARQLAYRLYTLCERAGWAEDARPYNDIMTGWSAIVDAGVRAKPRQTNLFDA